MSYFIIELGSDYTFINSLPETVTDSMPTNSAMFTLMLNIVNDATFEDDEVFSFMLTFDDFLETTGNVPIDVTIEDNDR